MAQGTRIPGVGIERTGAALVVRLATLIEVEIAAITVQRLVRSAQGHCHVRRFREPS
jgi:hypothetical protein